jgi:hypothetical protein
MQFATELLIMNLAGKVEQLNKTALVDLIRELKMVKEDIDFTDTLGVVRVLKAAAAKAHIVRNDADQSVVMKIEFESGKGIALNFGKCDDITYGFFLIVFQISGQVHQQLVVSADAPVPVYCCNRIHKSFSFISGFRWPPGYP